MNTWRIALNSVVLCSLLFLIACGFSPFGSVPDDDPSAPPSQGGLALTPEQITMLIKEIQGKTAVLPLSLEVPAYSSYRFDLMNAMGAHRGAVILSYEQAVASPTYGIESTARVLIYEAMKARAGHSIDYFGLSQGLPSDRITPVINAIAAVCADPDYLLKSSQNIASAPQVAQAINDLVSVLPPPPRPNSPRFPSPHRE